MALLVKKFGGTSVGTIERINAVADYLTAVTTNGDRCICVVSAMAGQTNHLLALAGELSPHPPKREVDMLLSVGERIAMSLLSIALHHRGISAISLTGSQCGILTDQIHGNARISSILGDRIRSSLTSCKVVIVAGFQGVNPETKEITTLGRGGTDLSAVAVAHALKADRCDIYTDVDGIFTADPRKVPTALPRDQIAWHTVAEMAWAGAKVVHPRAAHLAYKFKIPVAIRNSFQLSAKGTLMTDSPIEGPVIEAITESNDRVYIEARLPNDTTLLGDLAEWLWTRGESASQCSQSYWQGKPVLRAIVNKSLTKDLTHWLSTKHAEVIGTTDVHLLSVVGHGFLQSPEILKNLISTIGQIPVTADTSNHTICVSLKSALSSELLSNLHDQLFLGAARK